MKKPNLFIVGAPKCGTTSLHDYLNQHPAIFMSDPKEPHHFGTDIGFEGRYKCINEYLSLFEKVKSEIFIGESSTWYLYSQTAAEEIFRFNPEAKIIIMLRNPPDMLYSHHSQALFNNDENIDDFITALKFESIRRLGKNIPKRAQKRPYRLYYSELAKYYKQVERYINIFGKSNVFIIIFEEFFKNPQIYYNDIMQFLNLECNVDVDFRILNSNKVVRSKMLMKITQDINPNLIKILRSMPFKDQMKNALINFRRLNTKSVKREPLSKILREEILHQHAKDIDSLSNLTGKNFHIWLSYNI